MPDETSSDRPACSRCGSILPEGTDLCPACEGPTELWAPESEAEAEPPAHPRTPGPSHPSSDPSASRFPPGTMLADRYRIVSLLGSGGMGEVYRAEDLKLGQTVALKFLPRDLARSTEVRERLYQEVRLGRQVSHPNVCRLYDVVEWQNHIFVTMEYIDGEDLASLVRRIGSLPPAKVLELAREICAGLAAAHGVGVLHRDLKPANVMIDGRGRARITDFGLAVLAEEAVTRPEIAGTPVYMAPEQLRGEPATHRTDLYALGLVLYETLTGERLFEAGSIPELLSRHEESRSEDVSGSLAEAEPALQRVIDRCLRERPEDRPPSIHAVIAALPGGDPLQAAVDAGDTPSPELVAAAEGPGTLRPLVAGGLFATITVVALLNATLAPTWQVPGMFPVPEGPEVLAARARDILQDAGVDPTRGSQVHHFTFDWDIRLWLEEKVGGDEPWADAPALAPSPAQLWYRYAPEGVSLSARRDHTDRVTPDDPALDEPGMAHVRLDAFGRLLELTVVPAERPPPGEAGDAPWTELLEATRLDLSSLEATSPEWMPPVGSTERRAWVGTYPGQPDLPIRVEAAAAGGSPVWLRVMPPWTRPAEVAATEIERWERSDQVLDILLAAVLLLLTAAAAWLARRNLRRGRGDRKGALRLGLLVGCAWYVERVLGADLMPDILVGQLLFLLLMPVAWGFAAWLYYLALEPYLRRIWPRLLVGWHRLVTGRVGDPRIGREILVGLTLGALFLVLLDVSSWALRLPLVPYSPPLGMLDHFRDVIENLAWVLGVALTATLAWSLVLLLATLLLRRRPLGVAGLWVVMLALGTGWSIYDFRYFVLLKVLFATIMALALVRFGLLALAAALSARYLLEAFPVTLDPSAWYFPHALVPLLVILGLAGWAAWRSLGEQADLARLLGEEPAGAPGR